MTTIDGSFFWISLSARDAAQMPTAHNLRAGRGSIEGEICLPLVRCGACRGVSVDVGDEELAQEVRRVFVGVQDQIDG